MGPTELHRPRWCDAHDTTYTLARPCPACQSERDGVPRVFRQAFAEENRNG